MALPHLRRPLATALALAAAGAFPARAGIPLRDRDGHPMRWDLRVEQPNVRGGKITYFVDPLTSREEPPGADTERDAIHAAGDAWGEATGGRVRFEEDPSRVAYGKDGTDRVNYMGWKSFTLSPFTLAATYTTSTNGVITDADVIFNDTSKFVLWATATPGLSGYADVQSIATHEMGHVLGLDHSPVATSTMSPLQSVGTISSRSLAPDDAGGAAEAYPDPPDPATGSIVGRVRLGRRPVRRGLAVFAFDGRTGEVAGSAFTGDDGSYRIRALPPGPYRVAAAPLAAPFVYSSWWAAAPSRILPACLEDPLPGGGSAPRTVMVHAGFPVTDLDIGVQRYRRRSSGEPDDGPAEAREILPGGVAAGVFERPLDEDWYRLRVAVPTWIDVRVRSWGIGADADAEVAILAADGETVLDSNIDIRPPVDEEIFGGALGVDKDALIEGFVAQGPGDLFVRVRVQPQAESGSPASFYLLEVTTAAGVPDPLLSTASVAPPAARIGGGAVPVLTALPRDVRGDPVGPGASVTALRSDGGAPLLLADLGDGTYASPVPLPAAPGDLSFTLEITAPRGSATVPGAATLSVAGTADAARSSLAATPRRVEAGAAGKVTLVFTPRDAGGRLLGAGLDAAILFEGPPAGTLGPTADLGDGAYGATLTAPADPSSARLSATVDGAPTGVSARVGFGWDLPLVAADLGATVVEALGLPGVSRRESKEFGRAGLSIDGILAGLASSDEPAAADAAARAVAALDRAGRSPRFPGGAAAARDLAEALRRRVHALLDPVVFVDPYDPGVAILARARFVLAGAEVAMIEGRTPRAARLFAAALRKAGALLPTGD